ncbi:MAG: 16S rRNA (guanine(966)-N(2))-methyltransferase RsmD [Lentisphaerae bacterium]|nr:16S rRNA (guanine(966)-N(2))-methyltransferase RsmD [Lentisphaerota bacterium]
MRITGGEFRGRVLRAPKAGVRPTQDRVRQAVFNILMDRVAGERFLDLYAGSGAVGLEALSRGASEVVWVEQDRRALSVLRANVADLGHGAGQVVADDVIRFLGRVAGRGVFDVVYADPPYTDGRDGGEDPLPGLLVAMQSGGVLAKDGILVYESSGGRRARGGELPPGWTALVDRTYGRARVRVFGEA